FTDEFKRDAVAQVEDRGYPVREVAERLGVCCPAGECETIAEREHQVDLHVAEAVFAADEGDSGG
ncbi:transposase, partial [Pseudorhodobacter sp. E13]